MLTKSAPCRIKATSEVQDDGDKGEFEALVSVFGNVDSYGERVVKGAFAETLKEWKASGDPVPVIWSHQWGDPFSHVGQVLEAEERDEGLWVRGRVDLDEPKAAQVWRLLKGRRVTQFSFAYDVIDAAPIKEDGEYVYELRRLKLHEVGPTLLGVNQETELLDAKALDVMRQQLKAGRVLSAKNEGLLRDAHQSIGDVLAALDDDGKATAAPGSDAASDAGKATGPTRSPATVRLLAELDELELELT